MTLDFGYKKTFQKYNATILKTTINPGSVIAERTLKR